MLNMVYSVYHPERYILSRNVNNHDALLSSLESEQSHLSSIFEKVSLKIFFFLNFKVMRT